MRRPLTTDWECSRMEHVAQFYQSFLGCTLISGRKAHHQSTSYLTKTELDRERRYIDAMLKRCFCDKLVVKIIMEQAYQLNAGIDIAQA